MDTTSLLIALAAALWPLLRSRRALAGTTLRAAWFWALAAELIIAGTAMMAEGLTGELHYAASITTCLPIMAVLGAKRPQDRGWQFIVLSLWIVLALPCGQAWLLGRPLHVYPAWSWFLAAMLLVQLGNYLPTGRWATALLVTAAQALLLWDWLPWGDGDAVHYGETWNTWPAAGALGLVALAGWLTRLGSLLAPADSDPQDRLWRDFRDWFGALWALRVLERINTTARLSGWPVELEWHGFASRREEAGGIDPLVQAGLIEALHTLLRRFVSPRWIEQRLNGTHGSNGPPTAPPEKQTAAGSAAAELPR